MFASNPDLLTKVLSFVVVCLFLFARRKIMRKAQEKSPEMKRPLPKKAQFPGKAY